MRGRDLTMPTQAKTGLEWGTPPGRFRGAVGLAGLFGLVYRTILSHPQQ